MDNIYLKVLFELEGLGESLSADFTGRGDFPGMFSHVVQKVFPLAEDVTAGVALVLDLPGVDGDVFLEGLESGELPVADCADKVPVLVLHAILGLRRDLVVHLVVSGTPVGVDRPLLDGLGFGQEIVWHWGHSQYALGVKVGLVGYRRRRLLVLLLGEDGSCHHWKHWWC